MSKFMALALELAKKGHPSPNPYVGAVIVKAGKIIATGYHEKAGMPHAEAIALARAGRKANGANLYVNLEPCSHIDKRTPPCVDAIISAGIKKVVFAMKDPNPKVNGGAVLRKAGIIVEHGDMQKEAQELNVAFAKHIKTGMPYITLKMAMSLDGKIATKNGESKWISGKESRSIVQQMRARNAAILVGVGTVLADNPHLACEIKGTAQPLRVIIDAELRAPLSANVFRDANAIVFCSKNAREGKKRQLAKKGVKVIGLESTEGKLDFMKIASHLGSMGINSVLVEGGGDTAASALFSKCVDKIAFFIAPKIIGGKMAQGPVGGEGIRTLTDVIELADMLCTQIGADLLITASPRYK
jgi:diaminohydroxyphosphoribosylaminopyrimidine deaminase/5-amino-6-(5-phosphoribosylamino)uracil reductase